MNVPCLRQYGVHLGIVVFSLLPRSGSPGGPGGIFGSLLLFLRPLAKKTMARKPTAIQTVLDILKHDRVQRKDTKVVTMNRRKVIYKGRARARANSPP